MKNFKTVASLKLATLTAGQTVTTQGYTTAGDGGGAEYLIVAPQAADGFGDHVLANGNVAVLQVRELPEAWGIFGDGGSYTANVAAYIADQQALRLPFGTVHITSLPDLATINSGNNITVIGEGSDRTVLEITQDASGILFDNFLIRCKFIGMTIREVAGAGGATTTLGKCWDSSASGAAFVDWDDLRTIGFNVVGDVRQSVWCSIGTIECTAYGLKPLSFVNSLKGGAAPTSGWNIFPSGWFNNSLTVKNYLARNGTNGPVFEGSSISIDTLTTEGLTGDGLFVRGFSSTDKAKLVTIQNLYQENVAGTMINAVNVNSLVIEHHFSQGKAIGSPSTAILNADEANVKIGAAVGQDYFVNGATLANNSTLRGDVSGSTTGAKYVIDATSRQISQDENPNIKKWVSPSTADTFTFTCTDALSATQSNYTVEIGVVYNGTPFEVQSWTVWVPSSGTTQIRQNTNGSTRLVGVTKSGTDLVLTNNQTGGQPMVWTVTVSNVSAMAIDGK